MSVDIDRTDISGQLNKRRVSEFDSEITVLKAVHILLPFSQRCN